MGVEIANADSEPSWSTSAIVSVLAILIKAMRRQITHRLSFLVVGSCSPWIPLRACAIGLRHRSS